MKFVIIAVALLAIAAAGPVNQRIVAPGVVKVGAAGVAPIIVESETAEVAPIVVAPGAVEAGAAGVAPIIVEPETVLEPIAVGPAVVDFPVPDGGAVTDVAVAPEVPVAATPRVSMIININTDALAAGQVTVEDSSVPASPAVVAPEAVSVVESAPETVTGVEQAPAVIEPVVIEPAIVEPAPTPVTVVETAPETPVGPAVVETAPESVSVVETAPEVESPAVDASPALVEAASLEGSSVTNNFYIKVILNMLAGGPPADDGGVISALPVISGSPRPESVNVVHN